MTLAELIARTLKQAGTRRVWGMPGGASLPMLDAFEAHGIDFVLVRDETSAAFAADADAQLTGAPGACLATLGPGLTNLATGVAGCLLDRAPVLALTSRYHSAKIGVYTHQIFDQTAFMASLAKDVVRLTADGAPGELGRAVRTARAPRPGPVFVEVPAELSSRAVPDVPVHATLPLSDALVSEALVERVAGWTRPVVLVGFAARHAPVAALADALRAPVLTTYKAKGALPEGSGWSAGAAGLSPVVDAMHRDLLQQADGVLLIGWDPVELRDHWLPGWPEEIEVVSLDDHATVDQPGALAALHVGTLAQAVGCLSRRVGEGHSTWEQHEVGAHRERQAQPFVEDTFGPATAIRAVQGAVPEDAVVALDVGAHRITASHAWLCRGPDQLLQSNGLSSMGYGLPAALAAAACGRVAVCITGDMGLQLVAGELGVAVERGWTVVVVVLVDDALSLIALKQERRQQPWRGVSMGNPDWVGVALAFGGEGVVAESADAVSAAVRDGLDRGGLTVVAAPIDAAPYRRQM